jgi:3alpha(or 20beta)-hydroxysteroid dehydrogenase/cyclopentanol dehydrogenase
MVNNAAITHFGSITGTTVDDYKRVIDINQVGNFLGIRAAIEPMKAAGGGSIINVSSIYGIVGSSGSAAYHASKGAVRVLTKQAAVEYAPEGIRVNSIHPGYIDTAMLRAPFEGRPEELDKIIAAVTPMGRVGTAEEIANAALFLASDEASFMTGAEMVVDGGYTAR